MFRHELDFATKSQQVQEEPSLVKYLEKTGEVPAVYKREMGLIVSDGLQLERGIGASKATRRVRRDIIDTIVETTYYSSDYLNAYSVPEIGLACEWEDVPPPSQLNDGGILLADAALDVNHPTGLIRYTPLYLRGTSDYMMGKTYDWAKLMGERHLVADVTSHENYHLAQFIYTPEQIERDCKVLETSGFTKWNKTASERAAQSFGARYLTATRLGIDI